MLSGAELSRLAAGVYQVIDGEFIGTQPGITQPRLVVTAIDSSYYEVVSADPELLARIRKRFTDVRASPESAEQYAESGDAIDASTPPA